MTDTDRPTTLLGIGLVVVGVTLFAAMDACSKTLADTQSLLQIVWARYAFAVPIILATTPRAIWPILFRVASPPLQAFRGLLPMAASFAVVAGLALLPLAEVTALTFASPLVVVALSGPLLRERTSLHDWLGVLTGFAGILVIVRPGAGAIAWAALLPLACAFCFALFQLTTRLVGRSDHPAATLAWTIAVGLVVTTPLLLVDWRPVPPRAWAVMIFSGLCFGAAQYCLARAFRHAPAALLAPFTYTQIAPAAVLGFVLFGAVPDLWAAVGTAIVIGAGLYVLHRRAV
ncbi:MAG: DMT family transporter [Geminicoccaceae bacterium]